MSDARDVQYRTRIEKRRISSKNENRTISYLMKPYPGRMLDIPKKVYNYRLSRKNVYGLPNFECFLNFAAR